MHPRHVCCLQGGQDLWNAFQEAEGYDRTSLRLPGLQVLLLLLLLLLQQQVDIEAPDHRVLVE